MLEKILKLFSKFLKTGFKKNKIENLNVIFNVPIKKVKIRTSSPSLEFKKIYKSGVNRKS